MLKKSNGAEISSLQTGAGNTVSIQDPKTSKLVCKENMDEIGKAINILYAMREKIWQALQPRLRCERGKHNSPVLVLPLIVREKPAIKQMFTMSYRYVFKVGHGFLKNIYPYFVSLMNIYSHTHFIIMYFYIHILDSQVEEYVRNFEETCLYVSVYTQHLARPKT